MKKITIAALIAIFANSAAIAQSQTGNIIADASVEIRSPLNLTHVANAELHFGTLTVTDADGGTITVTPGAGSLYDPQGVTVSTTSPLPRADFFMVSGEPNREYHITLPTAGGTMTSGSASLPFLTSREAFAKILDGNGQSDFYIGGTLMVPANQAPGDYAGTYNVIVTYN